MGGGSDRQLKLHTDGKGETKGHIYTVQLDAAILYYYNFHNNIDNSDISALSFKGRMTGMSTPK
jgi:hypothetical protein